MHLEGNKKGTFASLVVSGGCYLQAGNGIKLGEGTIFAPNVAIISANHDMSRKDKAWLKQETNRNWFRLLAWNWLYYIAWC